MSNLNDTYTHATDIKGIFRTGTTRPTNEDVAGLEAGEVFINTDNKTIGLYNGEQWFEKVLTTTSTSTSTSTSTTTS
jgi:hypothetical protein